MEKYIVRCDRSGVFYGEVEKREGREVTMRNVRCLWYWDGAATLLQLASDGVANPDACKFTVSVDELTVLDAVELIPCKEAAARSIEGVPEWRV